MLMISRQSEWTVHGLTVPPHFSLLPFLILKPPLARKLPADIVLFSPLYTDPLLESIMTVTPFTDEKRFYDEV
jgi:hypothetical protein